MYSALAVVAVCCSVLPRYVLGTCRVKIIVSFGWVYAACCSVLQRAACFAVIVLSGPWSQAAPQQYLLSLILLIACDPQTGAALRGQCVAVCCSALQCVAVRCSVLQCGAMCCSVLQSLNLLNWIKLLSVTARSVEDETRHDRRNAIRNPEWWGDFSQLQN